MEMTRVYNNNDTILTSQQEFEIASDSNKKLTQPFTAEFLYFATAKNVYTVFKWNLQYLGKLLFWNSLHYYPALSENTDANILKEDFFHTEHGY